jgi:hypothetical protein
VLSTGASAALQAYAAQSASCSPQGPAGLLPHRTDEWLAGLRFALARRRLPAAAPLNSLQELAVALQEHPAMPVAPRWMMPPMRMPAPTPVASLM